MFTGGTGVLTQGRVGSPVVGSPNRHSNMKPQAFRSVETVRHAVCPPRISSIAGTGPLRQWSSRGPNNPKSALSGLAHVAKLGGFRNSATTVCLVDKDRVAFGPQGMTLKQGRNSWAGVSSGFQ